MLLVVVDIVCSNIICDIFRAAGIERGNNFLTKLSKKLLNTQLIAANKEFTSKFIDTYLHYIFN